MNNLPFSSAADRNRHPICEELSRLMPGKAKVLEIGSGTGQHAVHMTRALAGLTWQPTDLEDNIPGLAARFSLEGNERILPVIELDVLADAWPDVRYDAAYSANTAHIMSWPAVVAMFGGLQASLLSGARFFLYGPFNIDGQFTAESNRQFDSGLRSSNPHMGLRDMADMERLANDNGMQLEDRITMPANNFLLVFRKP
jgi:cyclopropane fatty-acyl-phospholipid synthase-like methyltransferase